MEAKKYPAFYVGVIDSKIKHLQSKISFLKLSKLVKEDILKELEEIRTVNNEVFKRL